MSDAFNSLTGADVPNATPWDDPEVKAALKAGRPPSDIAILECPDCGVEGYYNQGSHFYCRECKAGFSVVSEDEDPPVDRRYLVLNGDDFPTMLDEWEGCDHEG